MAHFFYKYEFTPQLGLDRQFALKTFSFVRYTVIF